MTPEQLRVTRIQSFIQLAKEELQVSAAIRMAHRRQSAYFLQQAVEKALRGILEVEGCVAGPMHSIRGLSDLLPAGHAFRVRFLDLEPLSAAATKYRYPTSKGTLADIDPESLEALRLLAVDVISDAIDLMETFLKDGR